jgi:Tol biopolymer transport system component
MRSLRSGTFVGLIAVAALAGAPTASAAAPGENGLLAIGFCGAGGEGFVSPGGICTLNPDGSGRKQITKVKNDTDPAWSPDGTRVAFTRTAATKTHIDLVNGDGSGIRALTTGPSDATPAWSPDGSQVVYSSAGRIVVIDVASGDVKTLDQGPNDRDPSWSSDGLRIAFDRFNDSGPIQLYIMDAGGGNAIQVAEGFDPAWAPTGTTLAFSHAAGAIGEPAIALMDGAVLGPSHDITSGHDDVGPAWSPDGRRIAFVRGADRENPAIWAMDADGSHQASLKTGGFAPDWQPKPAQGCADREIAFGPIRARATCFTYANGVYTAEGKVNLGGIELGSASSASGKIVLDTKRYSVHVEGQATVKLGQVLLYKGSIKWDFDHDVEVKAGTTASLKGFPITGDVGLKLDPGVVKATVTLGLPNVFGGFTATGVVTLDIDTGLHLDGFSVKAGKATLGPVGISDLEIKYDGASDTWEGKGTLELPPSIKVTPDITFVKGEFASAKVSAATDIPLPDGFTLHEIHFEIAFKPGFSLGGGMGIEGGPDVLGHKLLSASADMSYTSGDPSHYKLTGDLKLVEVDIGGASIDYSTDGKLTLDGRFAFEKAGFGVDVMLHGYVDDLHAFDAEGSGSITTPGPDLDGAALVSSKGIAACGHLLFADVGFGYPWGGGVGDITFMASSCDVGPWRVAAAARRPRAAQAVTLPSGLPVATFAAVGDSAPPKVTLTGPGGLSVATPADATGFIKTPQALLVQRADDRTTYIAVSRPRGGTWQLEAQPGSAAIVQVRQADGLPDPKVRAHVTGRAHRRTLVYRLRPRHGQVVRFSEQGRGLRSSIGVARGRSGRIAFAPADGHPGRRSILATIEQDGYVRRVVKVATYGAPGPARPARPAHVSARAAGRRLTVRWGSAHGAVSYEARVALRDGRRMLFTTTRRRLTVALLFRHDRAVVRVRGFSRSGAAGPFARASVS